MRASFNFVRYFVFVFGLIPVSVRYSRLLVYYVHFASAVWAIVVAKYYKFQRCKVLVAVHIINTECVSYAFTKFDCRYPIVRNFSYLVAVVVFGVLNYPCINQSVNDTMCERVRF